MKRLLVVTSTLPRWKGDHTPPFVLELSKQLAKEHEVHILAPYSKGSLPTERLNGLTIHRFKYWKERSGNLADGAILPNLRKNPFLWAQVPFYFICEVFAVRKLLLKYKFDAVHAHWILTPGLSCALNKALMKDAKFVITSHGTDIFSLKFLSRLKKWIINQCDEITVVSMPLKKEVSKLTNKKSIRVLPMGIDMSSFRPGPPSAVIQKELGVRGPLLLSVGRLTEQKGARYLIEAMPKILEHDVTTRLAIIGTGPLKDDLKALTITYGISDNVLFLGPLNNDELPEYYRTADIFIGPSTKAEGLGLVFVEAIACGCTVIATDLPSIKDIIVHKKNGYIVKERSSSDIATCVIRLLSNESDKLLLNDCRESLAERFDWKTIGKSYLDVLTTNKP